MRLQKRVLWLVYESALPFPESVAGNHLCLGESAAGAQMHMEVCLRHMSHHLFFCKY